MADNQDRIRQLLEKLEILQKQQQVFFEEIQNLKKEIYLLKPSEESKPKTEIPLPKITEKNQKASIDDSPSQIEKQTVDRPKVINSPKINKPKTKSNLEKFIGENLINKIGIIITVIGVAIGAKYSIENDLISPLTRIILGYLTGLGLLGVGMKLKKKYENYSAVLVSGAMAIMYFITFLGYSLYDLFPQLFAFVLMVVFTAFTVFTALQYNKQIIAHIGLVGAYAVPFLLSDGSGNFLILFSYVAIINIGILIIALKKYWKSLYVSSFIFTWLIYFSWYVIDYTKDDHFTWAFTFLIIFFVISYLMFLLYKLKKKENFGIGDLILQLTNSFIFYGIGFSLLDDHEVGQELLGVFTLGNAVIHFVVSIIIYKLKLADRNLFYFVSGMVLVFLTIAFPVQLDGNWVTLLWAGEAALLFWVGRTKKVPLYEKLSYPLILLIFFSILHDWSNVYSGYIPEKPETKIIPILNINLLTSLLCTLSFGFMYYLHKNKKFPFPWANLQWLYKMIMIGLGALCLFTLYFAFRMEIAAYWNQLYANAQVLTYQDKGSSEYKNLLYDKLQNLRDFKAVWLINYTLLFLTVLSFVNIRKLKDSLLGYITLPINVLAILFFLTRSLYVLSELRESYLEQQLSEFNQSNWFYIWIRYVSLLFIILLLFACYRYVRQKFLKRTFIVAFDFIMHISVIWILSSELIHWLDMANSSATYKLGLSILWGVYSLFLIVLGIWKKKQYLRILAFIWFGITLIKLFFYDISHLETIPKTIVFLSLGILLLIISFLYNKYKNVIADEED
ncbi:DUF2339 domain-containing protein [Aquimarina sp. MMG016]|uniref:DUF2339 domain-containing protein n=1 Tax=Aquimarina sp. MMG016 TaxID=2822690 RepID=UPI001B3A6C63|nr:DUF2339 domain-containing protein [Aquimarina sp. MMG016]MBQ4822613.1 DUF2339 domain-containing protein [Aquimarina sp. MMG016]